MGVLISGPVGAEVSIAVGVVGERVLFAVGLKVSVSAEEPADGTSVQIELDLVVGPMLGMGLVVGLSVGLVLGASVSVEISGG